MHQEIVLGEPGQAFELEAMVLPREPVSVVVASFAGEVQHAVAACAIDRVSTVLAEAAPRGARVLHVGSTRGITANTRYDVGGQRFTVYRVDGEHRLVLRRPLLEPAAEDAALRGCRIVAPVDDAWVRDVSKVTEHLDVAAGYQLVWTYDGGSERTTADLVRPPRARVTPDDVERSFPGWRSAVGDPTSAIAEASDIVRRDVLRHPSIRRARDAQVLRELVIMRARIVAVEEAVMFRGAPYSTLVAVEEPYRARIAELVRREPPETTPPAPPTKHVDDRFSLAHVPLIDRIMKWFEGRTYISFDTLLKFATTWMPHVRTRDERLVVARFLEAQKNFATKGARKLRNRLVEQLLSGVSEP